MGNIEVWKQHPEFCYIEVSTLGSIRTFDRVVSNGRGMYVVKGRILKQRRDRYGYLTVSVRVNGKWKTRLVHRLVAQTFIPNQNNLPQVNHKDCNRTNNFVDNLEWCNNSYNQKYRDKFGKSNTEIEGHSLLAVSLTTLKVSKFRAQMEASRELGINQRSIWGVIKGRRKQAGGYWFVNADENAIEATRNKFGDNVARKVEEMMTDKEMQSA